MLSALELTSLYREYRSDPVLSVYLDADQTDPANRSAWHTQFLDDVRDARRRLDADTADIQAFEAATGLLATALGDPEGFLPGRGWVGFATERKVLYAESVPVPMPNLVRWEPGIRVAPYLRALKQSRPVAVAIVDSRRARLFGYRAGVLDEQADLIANRDFGDMSESSGSKRAETTSGVRGVTGKDKAQTLQEAETRKMLEDAAKRLVDLAGPEGSVVVGGVDAVVSKLRNTLPTDLEKRTAERPRLSFDLPMKDIRTEIEAAASELSRARQTEVLGSVFDLAFSGGAACVGLDETERALKERRVRTLVLSDTLRRSDPDAADWLVGRALEGGASAIEVSGDAVTRLDQEGAGVAALLHYRLESASPAP